MRRLGISIVFLVCLLCCSCSPVNQEDGSENNQANEISVSEISLHSQESDISVPTNELTLSYIENSKEQEKLAGIFTEGIYRFNVNPGAYGLKIFCRQYSYGELIDTEWISVDADEMTEGSEAEIYIGSTDQRYTMHIEYGSHGKSLRWGIADHTSAIPGKNQHRRTMTLEPGTEEPFLALSSDAGKIFDPSYLETGKDISDIELFVIYSVLVE